MSPPVLSLTWQGGVALLEFKVASDVTADVTKIVIRTDKRITGAFTATGSSGDYSISTDGESSGTSVTYNLATPPVAPGGRRSLRGGCSPAADSPGRA